jgi:uncharacterized protein
MVTYSNQHGRRRQRGNALQVLSIADVNDAQTVGSADITERALPGTRLPLFLVLAFGLAWGLWLFPLLAATGTLALSPTAQIVFMVAGAFGPFFAAFIALHRDGGWPAMLRFAQRSVRYRIGPHYLIPALFLMPVAGSIAALINTRLGGPAFALAMPASQIPLLFIVLFFIGGSVNEEFGWAYAIDQLQRRQPLLPATIILGLIWGFWHLPLFFIAGASQSFMPFWAFVIFAVGARIIFVWAYEGTGKSLLVTLLFHTTTNLTFNLFALLDRSPQPNEGGFISFALLALAVAIGLALASPRYRRVLSPG